MVFDESSCAHTTSSWKISYFEHDSIRCVNGVCAAGATRWVWKERMTHLLLEREIHSMWDELFVTRKDMLCLGVGNSQFEAVYVELHYLVGIQNRFSKVHLRKAHSHWENSLMACFVVRVRYCLCHPKGSKREHLGRLSSSTTHKWLSAYASIIPWQGYYGPVWGRRWRWRQK